MALVSPMQSFRGYGIREALADFDVRTNVSAFVAYGGRENSFKTSGRRICRTFERSHTPIPANTPDRKKKQDLFTHELPTSLQGTRLLSVRELKLRENLREFIALRVVARRDQFPWKSRVIN